MRPSRYFAAALIAALAPLSIQAQEVVPTSGIRRQQSDCLPAPSNCPPIVVSPAPGQPGTQPPGTLPPGADPSAPMGALGGAIPEAGGSAMASNAPHVMGFFPSRFVTVQRTTPVTVRLGDPRVPTGAVLFDSTQLVDVRVPIAAAAAFQIAENESPRPVDRVFVNYNYFSGLNTSVSSGTGITGFTPSLASIDQFGAPRAQGTFPDPINNPGFGNRFLAALTAAQANPATNALYNQYIRGVIASGRPSMPANASPELQAFIASFRSGLSPADQQSFDNFALAPNSFTVQGSTFIAADGQTLRLPSAQLHRETFGFEKTFLNGNASFGVRAPVFQMQGDGSFAASDFGDMTFITKYAFINDCNTGDVVSAGLAVTVPTGPAIPFAGGDLHSTLLQPFVGFIRNGCNVYVQGFSSLVVPTASEDVTILFNSISTGYYLFRDGCGMITSVTPTLELHLTTPLNNRGDETGIFVNDLLAVTGGVHLGVGRNSLLTIGASTPVTGPRLYDIEGFAQLNLRF